MAVSNRLKPFVKEFSLEYSNDVCFGMYDEYLVSFAHFDKSIELFIDARLGTLDRASYERLRGLIQSNSNGYGVKSFQLTATGLSVVVGDKDPDSLLNFFYMLINELRYLKVAGKSVCTNCGRVINGDEVIIKLGRHAHVCDAQCATKIEHSASDKEVPVSRGHSFLGIIGALVLCLASAAVYIYFGYRGWFCAWAAVLMPIGACYGFKLFGGKPSTTMAVTTIVLPAVIFPLSAFALLAYEAGISWYAEGYSFSIRELITQVWEYFITAFNVNSNFVVWQLLTGLAFLVIGYIFAIPSCRGRKLAPHFARLKE